MKRSLFRSILLFMLVASAVPIGLLGYAVLATSRERLEASAIELARERVAHLGAELASLLGESTREVESVIRSPGFVAGSEEERRRAITGLLVRRPAVRGVVLLDGQGEQRWAEQTGLTDAELTGLHEAAQRLLAARKGAAVRFSMSRHEPALTLLVPFGTAGEIAAVELSLAMVQAQLAGTRWGSRGVLYLVDAEGRVIAHPQQALVEARQDLSAGPVVKALASKAAAGSAQVEEIDGRVAASATVAGLGWMVVAEEPREDAFLPVRQMQQQVLLAIVAALLLAGALVALFSRRITHPLRSFSAGALQIAAGKFGVKVDVDAKNEIGELAQTFNYMSQQLLAYDSETQGLYRVLEEGYVETIVALANSIDQKDSYTRGHSQRVGELAAEIGKELKLPSITIRHLLYGGILHDVGKIGIVEPILCKRTRLTDDEMKVMREHPAIGATIIEAVSFLRPVHAAVRNHHERWDGKGYPDGLKGKDIPMVARIVNCADTWDACTSTRPYQQAMSPTRALEILRNLSGTQLDPDVVSAMERVVQGKLSRGERVSAWEESDGVLPAPGPTVAIAGK